MAKTKWFRCFVEGATASDGRVIEADWIDQIVANFNIATYMPRVNCEHIKGFSPEPPFNAYGDVTEVKASTDDIVIDGKTEKRRALYARVEANDQLVAIRKKGQKAFPSVELSPDFAGTGKVGLVGMAVTDNPASLGTEALNFSALKPMFDGRKQHPSNFFTAAEADTIELEAAPEAGLGATIAAAIAQGFSSLGFGKKEETTPPVVETPKAPANDNFDVAAFSNVIGTQIENAVKPLADGLTSLNAEFATIKGKLETTESTSFSRDPATGGGGNVAHETDC